MFVRGATEFQATSPEEMLGLLMKGMASRRTSSTGTPRWVEITKRRGNLALPAYESQWWSGAHKHVVWYGGGLNSDEFDEFAFASGVLYSHPCGRQEG